MIIICLASSFPLSLPPNVRHFFFFPARANPFNSGADKYEREEERTTGNRRPLQGRGCHRIGKNVLLLTRKYATGEYATGELQLSDRRPLGQTTTSMAMAMRVRTRTSSGFFFFFVSVWGLFIKSR